MKNVQIHFEEADGTKGVINYLSQDNVTLAAGTPGERERARTALLAKAHDFKGKWATMWPDTKFTVVEI